MSRLQALAAFWLLLSLPASGFSAGEVENFLANRKLLASVYFQPGSALLQPGARREIDELASRLRRELGEGEVLRVEGFASQEGTYETNVVLSMARAKAVRDYLRDRHGIASEPFLTGFGPQKSVVEQRERMRRVEVALYDDAFGLLTIRADDAEPLIP